MIISRTPFRISFFGGGTDYPVWCKKHGGAVLSTTINKYCYITCRKLPPFFKHKHRIIYSKMESVNKIDEIKHPAVREIFRYMNINDGLEIHHDADLPAMSGLGSSSSFSVGLLNALYAYKGKIVSKGKLANDAIYVEQDMIKENVGSQDQFAAAYGSLNKIIFNTDGNIVVNPIIINKERKQELQDHVLFFFSGFQRYASNIAKKQIEKTQDREKQLKKIYKLVYDAIEVLLDDKVSISEFGKLLDQTWKLKKTLTDKITNHKIDDIYRTAIDAGADGGKLIGAGGGGFLVFIARPDKHKAIKEKLNNLLHVPIEFENDGSKIVYYNDSI